jgi:release factor glutamine methyltransferase
VRLLRLPGVFPPHSDSWLLAEHMLSEPIPQGGSVLDLCTGSGLLAVLAARERASEVVAVDLSRRAVLTTQLNARLNGVALRVIRGDLFAPLEARRFDLIVSNPPYLPAPNGQPGTHSSARAWDAGPSGRRYLDRICLEAPAHLRPGGVLLVVHSSVCGEDLTLEALKSAGLEASVVKRRRGQLGPRLSERVPWLRAKGLVGDDGLEEMIIIRAARPR